MSDQKYVMVPVEPTPEMLVAINWPNDPAGYRAMLSVAPQAPDVQGEPMAVLLIGEPEQTTQGLELGGWDIEPNANAIEAFAMTAEPGTYQLCLAPQPAEQQPSPPTRSGGAK